MSRFDDIVKAIVATAMRANLARAAPEQIQRLRQDNPGVPADYSDFLLDVGYGSIGDGAYTLFSGLVTADEIFDPTTAQQMAHLRFFGTDAQGYCGALDPENRWEVVEINPTDMASTVVAPSFEEFIREKISELC